jgi:cation transport ATPase
MVILRSHRLVLVAFAATLAWRLGWHLSAALALTAGAAGWLLAWRAVGDLARLPGVEADAVLHPVGATDRRGAACAWLAAVAALLAWHFAPPRLAMSAALGWLVLAHDDPTRLWALLLPAAGAARLARRWGTRVPPAELARLTATRLVVLAESGVLTHGTPRVTDVVAHGERRATEVLRTAAALLRTRPAPLTTALMEAARSYRLAVPKADAMQAVAGEGIYGTLAGVRHGIGGMALATKLGAPLPDETRELLDHPPPGRRVRLVVAQGEVLGALVTEDEPRSEAIALRPLLAAAGAPPVVLLADVAAEDAERLCAERHWAGVALLAPSPQSDDAVAPWPLPGAAVVVASAGEAASAVRGAEVGVAITEPGESKPAWAAFSLAPSRLADLPAAWTVAAETSGLGRRGAWLWLAARLWLAAAVLMRLRLGGVVALDSALTLVALAAVRRHAEGEAGREANLAAQGTRCHA